MDKVNVFVVGAAKSGTSWLFECLKEHPEVLVSPTGEVDFFSYHYTKGNNWYHSRFSNLSGYKLTIDISPSYFTDVSCPRRIADYNHNAKIVLVIRHPIERAYSHYCMHLRGGKVSRNIDDEIILGTRYIEDSLYSKYLTGYFDYFDRHQVSVLSYDSLVADPRIYFKRFCELINVQSDYTPKIIDKKYHQKKGIPKNQFLYNALVAASGRITKNPKLGFLASGIDEFRKSKHVAMVHRLVGSTYSFPSMSQEKYNELLGIFCEDLSRLEKLTGLSFPDWYSKELSFVD